MAAADRNCFFNVPDTAHRFQPHISAGSLCHRCNNRLLHWFCLSYFITDDHRQVRRKICRYSKIMFLLFINKLKNSSYTLTPFIRNIEVAIGCKCHSFRLVVKYRIKPENLFYFSIFIRNHQQLTYRCYNV